MANDKRTTQKGIIDIVLSIRPYPQLEGNPALNLYSDHAFGVGGITIVVIDAETAENGRSPGKA
jgi:hypothetical protein